MRQVFIKKITFLTMAKKNKNKKTAKLHETHERNWKTTA